MFRKVIKEQLRVPAHIDYLAELREFISHLGKKHKIPESLIKSFKLAIDEAATNIIRHAYRETGEEGTITLRVLIRKESVTVCVIDKGKRFDPQQVKDPDLARYVKIGKKGGLGIFIIRKLMDDIEYRTTSYGNELRLTKSRETESSKIAALVPGTIKKVSLSIKAKFWARTSLILAVLTGCVYAFNYYKIPRDILNEEFPAWQEIHRQIVNAFAGDKSYQEDLSGWRQTQLLSSFLATNELELLDLAIVDSTGKIEAHSTYEKNFGTYDLPADWSRVADQAKLMLYAVALDSTGQAIAVYDYAAVLPDSLLDLPGQSLHIRIYKSYIDRLVSARRWTIGRLALLLFGAGSGGAFLLIYLLMNPLRKLAEFVRSGGESVLDEEIEIDPSSEVGEIAKAFSDITAKFRESQKHLAEQERLQQEMQVAKEIQQTLLPHEFPDLEGYEIAGHYEAAQLVGGDYYDFVEVDRDTLGIVVADVSGKGVPGSMVMTMIRQALRTESRGVKNAAEVLARLNDLVMGDMRKGMFVTIFYVIIDSKRRRLNFASAGHNPMILHRGSTNKTYYLNPRGFPIGIELAEKNLFRESIESDTIQLIEGDLVLLYTDGITEAMDGSRELFGEERLLETLRTNGGLGADLFVERLSEDIQSFTGGHPQSDDITFVTIREKTTSQKEELRRAKEAYRMILSGTSIRNACQNAGISTFSYYNKYKRTFDEAGIENFEVDELDSLEARHIAIEDKSKIFDIIKNHPEYGAKRISDELNTEKYQYTLINENRVYDELVRNRLNTRQLREAFVARGGLQSRKRGIFKAPGTPMLTLDGRIIMNLDRETAGHPDAAQTLPHRREEIAARPPDAETAETEPPAAPGPQTETPDSVPETPEPEPETSPAETEAEIGIEPIDLDFLSKTQEETSEVENILDAFSAEKSEDEKAAEAETTAPEQEEPRGFLGLEDLLREEIDKTFVENHSHIEDADPAEPEETLPKETPASGPFHLQDAGETQYIMAGIDELLNEDALDTTTVSIEGEIDLQSDQGATEMETGETEVTEETTGDDFAGKASTGLDAPESQTKRSLLYREQCMTLGYRHYKAQNYVEAIRQFKKVVTEFPEYRKAQKILGNAYFRAGHYEEAIETYRSVREKDPSDTAIYENLGIAYIKTGKFKEAIREWESLLKVDPTRRDIREKLDYFYLKLNISSEN